MDPKDIKILVELKKPASSRVDKKLRWFQIIHLEHVRKREIVYLMCSHLESRESPIDDSVWGEPEVIKRTIDAEAIYSGGWSIKKAFFGLTEIESLEVVEFFLEKTISCETKIPLKTTCRITVFRSVCHTEGSISLSKCTLLKDLELFFTNRELSDVTLVLDGGEVKAHKAILAARSPVFKAMFSHDMVETKSNRVEILDVKVDAMEEVLKFLYTGEASLKPTACEDQMQSESKSHNTHEYAIRVLYAASKYQLEDLKFICETYLIDILSIESFYDTLVATECYQMPDLRSHITRFLIEESFSILDRAIENKSIFFSTNFLISHK